MIHFNKPVQTVIESVGRGGGGCHVQRNNQSLLKKKVNIIAVYKKKAAEGKTWKDDEAAFKHVEYLKLRACCVKAAFTKKRKEQNKTKGG